MGKSSFSLRHSLGARIPAVPLTMCISGTREEGGIPAPPVQVLPYLAYGLRRFGIDTVAALRAPGGAAITPYTYR